jgi:hypothetical protein
MFMFDGLPLFLKCFEFPAKPLAKIFSHANGFLSGKER